MSETRFPYGYQGSPAGMGTMLTRVQLEAMKTVAKLHPEYWRRVIAMMEAAAKEGVALGVGTGWRIQPDPPPPGFARPGNSNHEGFPADGEAGMAVAIDHVPETAWDWMERNCARFGLRTFRDVNDEPWHSQPSDIPAGRDWRSVPWVLPKWDLPDDEEEDMPLTQDEINKIAKAVWDHKIDTTADDELGPQAARFWLHRPNAILRQYIGTFSGKKAPVTTMLQTINQNVKKLLK